MFYRNPQSVDMHPAFCKIDVSRRTSLKNEGKIRSAWAGLRCGANTGPLFLASLQCYMTVIKAVFGAVEFRECTALRVATRRGDFK
jgi:hypothetical protein